MARTKLQYYFLATGVVFSAIFSGVLFRALQVTQPEHESTYFIVRFAWTIFRVTTLTMTFLLAVMCFHISHVRASKYHTVTSMLMMYIFNGVLIKLITIISRGRSKFDSLAKDARRAQEEFLLTRMKRDADTAYGKMYNFDQIKSLEDLRSKHPLTSYDHYEEFIQRMANGEKDVLIAEELLRFGITSGTTGKGKLIPLPKSRFYGSGMSNNGLWASVAGENFGYASPLQKDLSIYVNPLPTKTPAGDVIGPMMLYPDDPKIKFLLSNMMIVPWEVTSISTEHEAHYITLLFALRETEIATFMGPFSSQIHKAMTKMEKHWKQLVHDIRTGTIDKDLQISSEVRDACEKALTPEPERADELRREFETGFEGIIRRVWPQMLYVFGISTSDFSEKLRQKYAKGVPVVSGFYASTESDYGINLWPDEDKYALYPHTAIYEFIPEEDMNEANPKTLFLDEVKKGETYEMVISAMCGFYRYRFGDVIKVVDFHYNVPVVKFMYRSGQLLNLRAEKVTETSVEEAVTTMTDANVVGWTAAESTLLTETDNASVNYEEGSQFYLIFVELEGEHDNIAVTDKQQQQFDEALKERNNYYRGYRNAGTISPPRVYLVKPGTFKALQDYIVAHSTASYNQFKLPRKLKTSGTLNLMLDSRLTY